MCAALEKVGVPKALVFISTVAVYGRDFGELITELHPLNGNTPYAKSKIMAEKYGFDIISFEIGKTSQLNDNGFISKDKGLNGLNYCLKKYNKNRDEKN